MKRTLALLIFGTTTFAFLINDVWSPYFPPEESEFEDIARQQEVLVKGAIGLLAFAAAAVASVIAIWHTQLSSLNGAKYAHAHFSYVIATTIFSLSALSGILLLLNSFIKPPAMKVMPLALFSVRMTLLMQALFLFFGLACALRLWLARK